MANVADCSCAFTVLVGRSRMSAHSSRDIVPYSFYSSWLRTQVISAALGMGVTVVGR